MLAGEILVSAINGTMMTPGGGERAEPFDRDIGKSRDQKGPGQSLSILINKLDREAQDRVFKRRTVEIRWLQDLTQLAGEYEGKVKKDLDDAKKSAVFMNLTRNRTNGCEARLSDMLFPTDDDNWTIEASPVPEMAAQAQQAAEAAQASLDQANQAVKNQDPNHAAFADQANKHLDLRASLKARLDEAKKRASGMKDVMRKQLGDCNYAIAAREAIRDACEIGSGIIKGPVSAEDNVRRAWVQSEETGDGLPTWQLSNSKDPRAAYYRVDYWNFFPDPEAVTVQGGQGAFERHLMTDTRLRRLARLPGFDKEAIRRLLDGGARDTLPVYLSELRGITGENQAQLKPQFQVWEYRGPISGEDLSMLCECLMQNQGMADRGKALSSVYQDVDPLTDIQVVLWFCQGELLSIGPHHLDSNDSIYSVYNLEKDTASPWGFGIPWLMRDTQSALNAAWRTMMDNAGLSARPQIIVDLSLVDPADETLNITSGKVWLLKNDAPKGAKPIEIMEIPDNQQSLSNIIELCKQFSQDETSVTEIAMGEQGAHMTKTQGGMTLLMNATNVVFRRFVKNFDDQMTVPNMERLYDWNMQFNARDDIKGDFKAVARGSSVLLVREVQAQNLMTMANLVTNPILGVMLKAVNILRRLSQSMMIPADDIIKTDEELQEEADKMAAQPPKPDEISARIQIALIEANSRLKVALIQRETQLALMANKMNMTVQQLKADLAMTGMELDSKEHLFMADAAIEHHTRIKAAAAQGAAAAAAGPARGLRQPPQAETETKARPIPSEPPPAPPPEATNPGAGDMDADASQPPTDQQMAP